MKMKAFFMAVFTLFLAVAAISAQEKTTNFAGSWELDASKSKLDERMRVESMTLNVTQTDKELKVESKTVRAPRPESDNNGGGMNRGGGMGRGGFGGGDGTITYSLDGKETKIQQESQMGQIPVTLKAKFEKDGRLKLTAVRSFNTPMGEISLTVKEMWELSEDGKTLKIKRDIESPRGAQSTEMVFNKK